MATIKESLKTFAEVIMTSFTPSIDNERPDIAPSEWGDCDKKYVVNLVIELIKGNHSQKVGNKSDVFWGEIETISEAVNEACIQLGLSDECFNPFLRTDGAEFEISLY